MKNENIEAACVQKASSLTDLNDWHNRSVM